MTTPAATVTRKWRELQDLRKTLVSYYYHLVVPPLYESDVQTFFNRISIHRTLRKEPELHLFLGMLTKGDLKKRSKTLAESKERPGDRHSMAPEELRRKKQDVEHSEGSKQFDDPLLEKFADLKSSASKFQQTLVDTQTHVESMVKADQSYTRGLKSMMDWAQWMIDYRLALMRLGRLCKIYMSIVRHWRRTIGCI